MFRKKQTGPIDPIEAINPIDVIDASGSIDAIDPVGPKYALEELMSYSDDIFHCRPEVVAGAVHGRSQNEYTVEELRQLINNFLNRKVNG